MASPPKLMWWVHQWTHWAKCFWQMKNMVEGFWRRRKVKLYLIALFTFSEITYTSLRENPVLEAEAMLWWHYQSLPLKQPLLSCPCCCFVLCEYYNQDDKGLFSYPMRTIKKCLFSLCNGFPRAQTALSLLGKWNTNQRRCNIGAE